MSITVIERPTLRYVYEEVPKPEDCRTLPDILWYRAYRHGNIYGAPWKMLRWLTEAMRDAILDARREVPPLRCKKRTIRWRMGVLRRLGVIPVDGHPQRLFDMALELAGYADGLVPESTRRSVRQALRRVIGARGGGVLTPGERESILAALRDYPFPPGAARQPSAVFGAAGSGNTENGHT